KESHAAFATNTLREATFFRGVLGRPLVFREGLAALHDVVVSDFKYHARDRLAFNAWLEEQDRRLLAGLGIKSDQVREKMREIEARLDKLDQSRLLRLGPFHKARQRYFDYVFENQFELSY